MNDREQQVLLGTYRPWLRAVAMEMTRQIPQWSEDLAQEGWVAMWRKLCETPNAPDSWLKNAAIRQMQDVLKGFYRQRRDVRRIVFAGLPSTEPSSVLWAQFQCDLGEVELAYHHGEIAAALSELPPRQRDYIILKFWYGYSYTEFTQYFGSPRDNQTWIRSKTKLARKLAHLEQR